MTPSEFMNVCRLCLVKEKVSIPIFEGEGEKRQIFTKIATCLPVKVEKHDCLPKKICDVCLYTIESVFKFWNTTASSEKILLQWLEGTDNVDKSTLSDSFETEELILKEERGDQEQSELLKSQDNEDSYDDAERHEDEGCSDGLNSESNYVKDKFVEKNNGTKVDGEELEPTTFVNVSMACNDLEGSSMVQTEQIETESVQHGDLQSMSTTQVQVVPEAVPSTSKNVADSSGLAPEEMDFSKTCEFCGKFIKNVSKAIIHRRKHTGEKPYLCHKCGSSYVSANSLGCHLRVMHADEGQFTCDICGLAFEHGNQLRHHRRQHSEAKKYLCDVCARVFYSRSELDSHKRIHFKAYSVYCYVCNLGFYKEAHLRHHMVRHSGMKPFKCQFCDVTYVTKNNLLCHVKAVHSEDQVMYKCDICNKAFSLLKSLRRHKKRHEGAESSVCNVCGKLITTSYMIVHMRTHTGERPVVCNICKKTFKSNNYLRTHMRVHSGEKPYSCKRCGKSFTQRSTLVVHMRSHTGERPYSCNICSKSYVTHTLLRYHQKTHVVL